jgi:hypothetical protein
MNTDKTQYLRFIFHNVRISVESDPEIEIKDAHAKNSNKENKSPKMLDSVLKQLGEQ